VGSISREEEQRFRMLQREEGEERGVMREGKLMSWKVQFVSKPGAGRERVERVAVESNLIAWSHGIKQEHFTGGVVVASAARELSRDESFLFKRRAGVEDGEEFKSCDESDIAVVAQ
jgi:hypothetical protein